MIEQGELFPRDVYLEETIAMQGAEQFVRQCNWCGCVIVADHATNLGPCPACDRHTSWWESQLPVCGLRKGGSPEEEPPED